MISMRKTILKIVRRLANQARKVAKIMNRNIIFSLGENCLPDNILARNGLKSFSSPYASGRSNIEYVLAFEHEQFSDFLNLEHLKYEYFSDKEVARNKKYVAVKNRYNESCTNGFEFTHHDAIGSKKYRYRLQKRCKRMLKLKNKNIIMLYHHRMCSKTDESLLVSHLLELADLYKLRGNSVHIYAFTQVIISGKNQRRSECIVDRDVTLYKFYTQNEWAGNDDDIFWAKCDDDLLEVMILDIKQRLCRSLPAKTY